MKQSIRSAANHTEGIYKRKFNDELKQDQTEYNLLNILYNKNKNISSEDEIQRILTGFDTVQNQFNKSLERRSKYLAQRARIQWTEKGGKSNKYFLNLIKAQNAKQEFNSLVIDNVENYDRKTNTMLNRQLTLAEITDTLRKSAGTTPK